MPDTQVVSTQPSNRNGYRSFRLGKFELARDEYFVTVQARDGSIQARNFSVEGFATNYVKRVGVVAGQFAREIAKVFPPRV